MKKTERLKLNELRDLNIKRKMLEKQRADLAEELHNLDVRIWGMHLEEDKLLQEMLTSIERANRWPDEFGLETI